MSKNLPVIALVVLGLLYGVSQYMPSFNPLRPEGPDMVTAFSKDAQRSGYEARKDAKQFAALCQSLHDTLQGDWDQPVPYITTGEQVNTLRVVSRRVFKKGVSYNDSYPALKKTLEDHFSRHIDSHYGPLKGSSGPLTPEVKAAWLLAFKELADCSEYAAGRL